MSNPSTNPFAVTTPDWIDEAKSVVLLFVDVFSDFYHVPHPGHTFVHGARGTGKTMMFRFLEPDCQILHTGRALPDLDFLGVYVPIKNTAIDLAELLRLRGSHADSVLGEHLLSLNVVARFLLTLRCRVIIPPEAAQEFRQFYSQDFANLIRRAGAPNAPPELDRDATVETCLLMMQQLIDGMHTDVIRYLRLLSFSSGPVPYTGALTGFLDFVVPLMHAARSLTSLPKGPIYLLLDDADNLNITQTRILNSWVATRSNADLCLKISTQLAYKTFLTLTNERILAPHDYSEVNIAGVYTSKKSKFQERMRQIVRKRLGQGMTPDSFFPPDIDQEKKVQRIGDVYRARGDDESRGYHARDDANRYARPDFIRELSAHRGGRVHYRYAGFEQLVHISSGVVRHFLDAASRMYAEEQARQATDPIDHIPPAVQDEVVRKLADDFLRMELDKIAGDKSEGESSPDRFAQLRNVIDALGNAFHEILISGAAERRVFSVALSDGGERDVLDVLRLGVRHGYFHESTIGAKVGVGRVPLFILSRRLAPFFTLDPTSFAGYQFMTSEVLRQAMHHPKTFIRQLKGKRGMAGVFADPQMLLPIEQEVDDGHGD